MKRLKALEKENVQLEEAGRRPVAGQGHAQGTRGGSRAERDRQRRCAFARRAAPEGAGKVAGPARKRAAVAHLEGILEVSQRRACEIIVQPRSTQRYRGIKRSKDAALAAELRRISAALAARLARPPSPACPLRLLGGLPDGHGAAAAGRDGDQRPARAAALAAGRTQGAAPAAPAAAAREQRKRHAAAARRAGQPCLELRLHL